MVKGFGHLTLLPSVTAMISADCHASVLLIETDPDAASLISDAVIGEAGGPFRVEWIPELERALGRLEDRTFDVILVGLPLPDCPAMDALERMRKAAPATLILPLSEVRSTVSGGNTPETNTDALLYRRGLDAAWIPHVLRYVTRRREAEAVLRTAEEALFEEKERAEVTLSSIGDAVLVTDEEGVITYLNPVAESMTGWDHDQAKGRQLDEVFRIIDAADREPATNPAREAISQNATVALGADCVLLRRDGSECGIEDSAAPLHDRQGRVIGAVIVFRDVTQSRAMARKMAFLAQHDALTGLANRALLNERLGQAVRLAERHRKKAALLFVDLDDFKQINDTLGHAVGDHVLQAVASILTHCVRTSDTVCRQGGDEFVILLAEIDKKTDADQVAEKVIAAFSSPLVVDGHSLRLSLSIGIGLYPEDGNSAEVMLQSADAAMYHAKHAANEHNNLPQMQRDQWSYDHDCIRSRLHRAFEKGEFVLHYQPQIDLTSGRIHGVEALVRWQDPDQGLIYPEQFMPLAERCGLIVPIGHWVFQQACRQVSAWSASGLGNLTVGINISATELHDRHFASFIHQVLREYSLAPDRVELELAENVLMQDADSSIISLRKLKDQGVHVAIDDFGTGSSSLSYLRRFPVDTLKMDRSLMIDVSADPETTIILRSLIRMGQSLKHRVVAEGVETLQQLGFLQAQLCDAAQGYRCGRPLSAGDFCGVIASERAQQGQWLIE